MNKSSVLKEYAFIAQTMTHHHNTGWSRARTGSHVVDPASGGHVTPPGKHRNTPMETGLLAVGGQSDAERKTLTNLRLFLISRSSGGIWYNNKKT